ncbi:MAG: circadian clock protein LdpA [Spirulina sp.]
MQFLSPCSEPALPLPYRSLQVGQWVKLICGASYQDIAHIRRLVMVYALAGVDCVDVAADVAVVGAARQGLADAVTIARCLDAAFNDLSSGEDPAIAPPQHFLGSDLPWLMVSLNDSEDPHFRKAFFDAAHCPVDCRRPCETICPTDAIRFETRGWSGVIPDLCYGCGRCLTVCPVQNIEAYSYQARPENFSDEALGTIDAVEIHTQAGRQEAFSALWQRLVPWRKQLKLVSISCPDDPNIKAYLQDLHRIMSPLEIPLIWQTDGRPMSGDLGRGTTHATIRLAQKVMAAQLPGYVQLAGGTNHYTASKLRGLGLVARDQNEPRPSVVSTPPETPRPQTVAGIAYGSYARTLVMPLLDHLEPAVTQMLATMHQDVPDRSSSSQAPSTQALFDKTHSFWPSSKVETFSIIDSTSALKKAIALARQLVGSLKNG